MTNFWFDESEAQRAVDFFEGFLQHSKGEFAGKPFLLEGWQSKIIREIFGSRRADGTRQYRTVYIEIPRKNGKSTLCAGLALFLTFADGEAGAEVYSAAADTQQAHIVFDEAKNMVLRAPALSKRAKPYRRSIIYQKAGLPMGRYMVLSADADTKHGFNASGIVIDELHAQPNRELFDVLNTSTGSRRQPLSISITTAGWDRNSICWELHEYAERVAAGLIDDPSFYGAIWKADESEDWTDPDVWAKANPNLGVSVKLDYLERECARAKESPAYENTFRRLFLNQWTEQETRWLSMAVWDACAAAFCEEDLAGRVCYGGLDLSARYDLTAFDLVFPPMRAGEKYRTLCWKWLPQAEMRRRIQRDRVPYDAWGKQGHIEFTPGEAVDYGFVMSKIKALSKRFRFKQVAYDRWGASVLREELERGGFEMIEFGQGIQSMSPPMKELLTMCLEGRFEHNGDPVLRWAASSMVAKQDAAGNIKPVKPDRQQSANRIDPMVALIMALELAIRNEGAGLSCYEHRGVLTI